MEKKTANRKAVCLSITYANVTVEKKFIVGGDELSKHPYSCGCTPKPKRSETGRPNDWALGYDKDQHAMTCMLKHTRAVYANCKSGVSGVTYNKKRKRWEAYITFQQVDHYLGSYKTKSYRSKNRRREEILCSIYQQREEQKRIKTILRSPSTDLSTC